MCLLQEPFWTFRRRGIGDSLVVRNRIFRAVPRDWQRRIAGSCLSKLWPVLYLAAERAPEILGAQAEWRTWLLRGPPAR